MSVFPESDPLWSKTELRPFVSGFTFPDCDEDVLARPAPAEDELVDRDEDSLEDDPFDELVLEEGSDVDRVDELSADDCASFDR